MTEQEEPEITPIGRALGIALSVGLTLILCMPVFWAVTSLFAILLAMLMQAIGVSAETLEAITPWIRAANFAAGLLVCVGLVLLVKRSLANRAA